MSKYKASLIGGQNIIFTPFIDISSDSVKFRVPGFLSGEEQTISIESITEISISGSIISKTISIYTTGMGAIHAEGFSPSDAKAVQREIEQNKKELLRKKDEERNQHRQEQYTYQIEQQSESEKKKKQYTDLQMIPLISFSSYLPQLFTDMNALLQYANAELREKSFDSHNRKKVEAYINKLEEGDRLADSFNLKDGSYEAKEREMINGKIAILKLGLESKLKGKRNRKLIKWAIWIAIILYVWRHFR